MNNNIIDIVAAVGKLNVERSNRSRDDKELAKSEIDVLSELLKSTQPQTVSQLTVYGYDLKTIQRVKVIAAQYAIEKIILFPIFNTNKGYDILIRVYGDDSEKVFKSLNIRPIYDITESDSEKLSRLEKENGVIIYEKD